MPTVMMWFWLILMSVLLVALGGAAAYRRARPRRALARVLAAHGAMRCIAAIPELEALARAGDARALVAAWDRLELPLVEVLPDCPPDRKAALVAACEALAQAATNRDTAKRIMMVRNSLVGSAPG